MLTSIVYFSKNRINNSENAVYEKLLSITPIGLLLEIGCNITAIYKMNDLVSSIISRLYLIFILVWLTTFTLYILTITKYKGDKLTEYKNSKIRKSIIIGSIFSLGSWLLKMRLELPEVKNLFERHRSPVKRKER